jgi:hypothetical protein
LSASSWCSQAPAPLSAVDVGIVASLVPTKTFLSFASARRVYPRRPPFSLAALPFLLRRRKMPSFPPQWSPTRLRSYVFRLPLTTRLLLAAILGLWAAAIPLPWVREVAALTPDKFDFTQSMWYLFHYRLMGFGWRKRWMLRRAAEDCACAYPVASRPWRIEHLGNNVPRFSLSRLYDN